MSSRPGRGTRPIARVVGLVLSATVIAGGWAYLKTGVRILESPPPPRSPDLNPSAKNTLSVEQPFWLREDGALTAEKTARYRLPSETSLQKVCLQTFEFVENLGQWDSPARFVAQRGPLTVRCEPSAIWLSARSRHLGRGIALRLEFENARSDVVLTGLGKQAARNDYFLGNDPGRWRTDVPLYSAVRYDDLYEGIAVELRNGTAPSPTM